jgi:hypothetical protein
MAINNDYRSAVELTGAAQAAAAAFDATMPLTAWLPARQNPTLHYSFDASGSKPVDVAKYRAFDTPAPYGALGPTITKEGELPPISRKLPVSEYRELQFANQLDMLAGVLDDYAARLGLGIAARLELARAEAVSSGKLTLAENGVSAVIDYGRDAALTVSWNWSATGATPLTDITTGQDLVTEKSRGSKPTTALITADVLRKLQSNASIITAALKRTNNLPSLISREDVFGVLAGYQGITNVVIADEAYSQFDFGAPVLPAGTFVLLPASGGIAAEIGGGSLGTTAYGVSAEAMQTEYGIPGGEKAGIFAGAFHHSDPEGLDVLASAVALPLLQRANATLGATVTLA